MQGKFKSYQAFSAITGVQTFFVLGGYVQSLSVTFAVNLQAFFRHLFTVWVIIANSDQQVSLPSLRKDRREGRRSNTKLPQLERTWCKEKCSATECFRKQKGSLV